MQCNERSRSHRLWILLLPMVFILGVALPRNAAWAQSKKQCVKTCKQQRSACIKVVKQTFKTTKKSCTGSDKRACKRSVKQLFKTNKKECKQLFKNTCKPCCNAGDVGCSVTLCGNGVVDVLAGESCDGGGCCSDGCALEAATTVCRPAAGDCDLAESCTGADAECPPDDVVPAGDVCRVAFGSCDATESCDGVNPACPPNGFQPAGTVCREAEGQCDAAETCTGEGAACPPDVPAPAGTPCDDGDPVCTPADACDGEGVCVGITTCGDGTIDAGCGEECETDGDCLGAQVCTGCVCLGALGTRTIDVAGCSFSSPLGGNAKVGDLKGTLELTGGLPGADGAAELATPGGPYYLFMDVNQGGVMSRLCRRISSCTGTIYCTGGPNEDVRVERDSLADGLTCVPDNSVLCGSGTCCHNACGGRCSDNPSVGDACMVDADCVAMGATCIMPDSGNASSTTVGINAEDSPPGSVLLECEEAAAFIELMGDCTAATYGPDTTVTYTTGTTTTKMLNECINILGPTTLGGSGSPFGCGSWTDGTSAGTLVFGELLEEPELSPPDIRGDIAIVYYLSGAEIPKCVP